MIEPQIVARKSNRTITITISAIFLIFVLFIVALWGAGFFSFSGSDPSSKIVAAALALVGGLVAAVVSIIGILLKHSIDQRTESRLLIESNRVAEDRRTESDRANALQPQAEQRLNLEAAIRAIELLGAEGSGAAVQQAGALYALSNLNQHDLTLDLTSYLLERGNLEPNVACTLINRALESEDEDVQSNAITVFCENAERMVTPLNTHVPDSIFNWDDRLCLYVREFAPEALSKILMQRPLSVWLSQFSGDLNGIIAILGLAWESEPDARLKADLAAILGCILAGFPPFGILHHPKKPIDITQIVSEVAKSSAISIANEELIKQLEAWKLVATKPQMSRT